MKKFTKTYSEKYVITPESLKNGLKKRSWFIYLFFLGHMAIFGVAGFFLAYRLEDLFFAFIHGGIAILVYLIFYLVLFGRDSVLWMVINGLLGVAQTKQVINFLGGLMVSDWQFSHYSVWHHVIPGTYVMLYTFLLRQFCIDMLKGRFDNQKRKYANFIFIGFQILVFVVLYFYKV